MTAKRPAVPATRDDAYFDQEALAAADSDAAVRSLQAEGRRSLDAFDSLRRVSATATAP